MTEDAIRCNALSKKFGSKMAVKPLDLSVKKNTIYGFLGSNGAGKSTVIRMLCGVLPPSSGNGTVLGYSLAEQPEQIKQRIGYMSQKFSLYLELTVLENLQFYGAIYGLKKKELAARIQTLLRLTKLEDRISQRAGALSGGWKQLLALCCAMLHEPELLILDEPTAGVDPVSRKIFWDIIHQLKKDDVTVLVTTHYMDEALTCDNIGFMYAGNLLVNGGPKEIMEQYGVKNLDDLFVKLVEQQEQEHASHLKKGDSFE